MYDNKCDGCDTKSQDVEFRALEGWDEGNPYCLSCWEDVKEEAEWEDEDEGEYVSITDSSLFMSFA